MSRTSDRILCAVIACAALSTACGTSTKPGGKLDAGPPDLGGFFTEQDLAESGSDMALSSSDAGMATGNASCAGALTLMNGIALTGQNTSTATETLDGVCLPDGKGAVLYYTVTIPAGNKMTAEVTPTDGTFDPVLRLLDTCTATSCAATADSGYEGDAEMITQVNTGTMPQTVIIAVGSYGPTAPGTFDIKVTMGSFAPNAVCMGAVPLTAGTPLTGQDVSGAAAPSNACLFGGGNVLYYSITVPARSALTVTATPSGAATLDPALRILATCNATSCLSSANLGASGDAETSTYRNLGMTAVPVLIAVGGSSSSDTGTFDLVATNAALPPPPVNKACGSPIAVMNGTLLTGQSASEGEDALTPACEPDAKGKVLYYSTSIPAHSKLIVRATPTGLPGWDAVVRILSMCSTALGCLASSDAAGIGGKETVSLDNNTASPESVIIAVGSYDAVKSGTFDLAIEIASLISVQPNAVCTSATAILSGQTKVGEDLVGTTVHEENLCLSLAVGPVLFYSIDVPAGQRLIALGKPEATWDLALRLLDSCTAMSCLASADYEYEGGAESLSYKNAGVGTKSVVLTVGNYTKDVLGKFDVSAWLRATPTNTSCAQATPVASATSLVVEDGESATTASAGTCVSGGTGKSLFYSVSIPAGKTLKVHVAPVGSWDPVVRLTSTCASTSCLASADLGNSGDPEDLSYTNSGASLKPVVIAVGGYGPTEAFDMQITIQ